MLEIRLNNGEGYLDAYIQECAVVIASLGPVCVEFARAQGKVQEASLCIVVCVAKYPGGESQQWVL